VKICTREWNNHEIFIVGEDMYKGVACGGAPQFRGP